MEDAYRHEDQEGAGNTLRGRRCCSSCEHPGMHGEDTHAPSRGMVRSWGVCRRPGRDRKHGWRGEQRGYYEGSCVLGPPRDVALGIQAVMNMHNCFSIQPTCVLSHFSHVQLCDPMDSSPPGSSVHGTLQARILEWIATPSSRGPSRPKDRTCISYVSCIGRQVLYH